MNHDYIEKHLIIDRYLLSKLPPGENARFEEHYLSCRECLTELQAAERWQAGLRRVVGRELARLVAVRRLGVWAWWSRQGRRAPLVAGGLAALLALTLAASLWLRLGDLDRELLQARQPQSNTPVVHLSQERGFERQAEPSHQLRLPSSPGWIVLALEIDGPANASYRATLLRDDVELWRGTDLRIDAFGVLTVSLHSSFVAPGDYLLRVAGEASSAPAHLFAIRLLPASR